MQEMLHLIICLKIDIVGSKSESETNQFNYEGINYEWSGHSRS